MVAVAVELDKTFWLVIPYVYVQKKNRSDSWIKQTIKEKKIKLSDFTRMHQN